MTSIFSIKRSDCQADKRELFEELIDEVRRSQAATDRFDQAVADAIGLNRTDMRCLDVLEREGPVTAGRLAEETGLTTGAMTTVARPPRARRLRAPRPRRADRRRVLVELDRRRRASGAGDFYGEHMALGERLYERYTRGAARAAARVRARGPRAQRARGGQARGTDAGAASVLAVDRPLHERWEAEAEAWARWVRTPGHDEWHRRLNWPAFLALLPGPGR